MASSSSPIHHFFNSFVQHEKSSLQQALFLTAANVLTILTAAAAFSLYYVLQTFLRPLLWAVLLGTFLYPFKQSATQSSRQWVNQLQSTGTPLMIAIAILPFQTIDTVAEMAAAAIMERYHFFIFISLIFVVGRLLYVCEPFVLTFEAIDFAFIDGVSLFFLQILGLGVCLILTWLFKPTRSSWLSQMLCFALWIVLGFRFLFWLGSASIPIVAVLGVLAILGLIPAKSKKLGTLDSEMINNLLYNSIVYLLAVVYYDNEATIPDIMRRYTSTFLRRHSEAVASQQSTTSTQTTPTLLRNKTVKIVENEQSSVGQSREIFLALIWACVILRVWMHSWLLHLLPVPVLYIIIKRIWQKLNISQYLLHHWNNLLDTLTAKIQSNFNWLLPKPLLLCFNILRQGDRKVITLTQLFIYLQASNILNTMLDKLVSAVIILTLIILVTLCTVILAFQIQQESVHLVGVTGNLINETVTRHPEFKSWLPEKDQVGKFIDSIVSSGYQYGKEWIRSQFKGVQSDSNINISKIERDIVAVLDGIYYQNWIGMNRGKLGHGSNHSLLNDSATYSDDSILASWKNLSFNFRKNFDYKEVIVFIKENVDMFLSVLRSGFVILRSNLDIAFRLSYLIFSTLFGGGTAVINFLVDIIVFLTTLFYLLSSSENVYIPVKWAMDLIPSTTGDKFGQAASEAIRGVFGASFKLAAFYGLYTWFTHSLFGVELVCIPSALSAIAAAIPFIGTYWVAVPAVLELWLVHDNVILAGLLLCCHCLPPYVIDIAIYREIKGGGHPYVTGLAVAGGIYCVGLEGAIVGPVLLCCFLVGCNVYSAAINTESSAGVKEKKARDLRKETLSRYD
ncbi:uncharacterized protein TRIADDRAFT_33619 [Trichoplax adhaerens]|uniref:Transmembrane protein 245 n=1 Tax=Trichoplax adhaerens TaxID=10228 RepID=B3SCW6_TRIAD|nr:hypothetical protein TRIADDRAFT_33619 [Trichoplax adhaerens]EDV19416.1 hypothetical protein TRIADDRAFT_33619 [Trichoplax adhaerens]|eukprot:XP_002118105.1 hypothetical protein TRIADDRAFT_33619 [Trichoplax adhaerens]